MSKNIIITGASSGIGKASAIKFASMGYNVAITGRRKENLEELSEYIENEFEIEVKTLNFDIRSNKETEINISSLLNEWQNIDLLLNNAGLAAGFDEFPKSDVNDWEQMIDTNIKGLLYISKIVSEKMVSQNFGHIINVGSIAGYNVYPKGHVYCASKYAVRALTEGMREDLIQHNIKVSSINPGMVETEFSLVRLKGSESAAKNVYQGLEPLKPEDVAETIYFMSSQPDHVNLADVTILPKAQANAHYTYRK
ncbi:SDR family NAD(P)-dependent oxidoreductase [Candidatus Kapabacteria bacterium]|nr:SDR family NAD(P)-dependent oxidoreductase [Candidatus Kapabacteria bacterium]